MIARRYARVAELADAPDLGCDLSQVAVLKHAAAANGKVAKASAKTRLPGRCYVMMSSHCHAPFRSLYSVVYEAPFTKASVVVGIETAMSPVITRRACKFLSLDRSVDVTS